MKFNPTSLIQPNDIPLDIRSDRVFKAVFTTEAPESRGALSNLVSTLIGKDVKIETIWANEEPVRDHGDRKLRYDINCRAKDGERINVEMSFDPKPYEPVRLEYHTGRLFTSQEISGEKDYNDLKRTFQIAILAQHRFFRDKEFFHTFEYFDPVRGVSLNGRTKIITLELIKTKWLDNKSLEDMDSSEFWVFFFQNLTDESKRDKINEIIKRERGIAMASQVLMSISRSEEECMRLLGEEKYLLDRQSELAYERKQGKREERQEILKMIKQGLSVEELERELLEA